MWPGQYIYLRKGVPDLCELTTQAMSKDELIVEPLSSDSQLRAYAFLMDWCIDLRIRAGWTLAARKPPAIVTISPLPWRGETSESGCCRASGAGAVCSARTCAGASRPVWTRPPRQAGRLGAVGCLASLTALLKNWQGCWSESPVAVFWEDTQELCGVRSPSYLPSVDFPDGKAKEFVEICLQGNR